MWWIQCNWSWVRIIPWPPFESISCNIFQSVEVEKIDDWLACGCQVERKWYLYSFFCPTHSKKEVLNKNVWYTDWRWTPQLFCKGFCAMSSNLWIQISVLHLKGRYLVPKKRWNVELIHASDTIFRDLCINYWKF